MRGALFGVGFTRCPVLSLRNGAVLTPRIKEPSDQCERGHQRAKEDEGETDRCAEEEHARGETYKEGEE